MRTIFYLTRSYLPQQSGGILMRVGAVELLRRSGFRVVVVTPGYRTKVSEAQNDIAYIPLSFNLRTAEIFERLGVYEDYLDPWVHNALDYLRDKVTKDDILFATSGGELGCIKLASIIKKELSCKYVINFRDPIDYSIINGLKIDNRFHVCREKAEERYIKNADLIITSSKTFEKALKEKYPLLRDIIVNNYFGYINKAVLGSPKISDKLRIAYGGIFGSAQSPQILAHTIDGVDGVEAYFIGDYRRYNPLKPYINKHNFIEFLPHEKYMRFLMEEVDVGFVSLANDYLGACVPSKIYEYINLGLPILGALPEGDAMDIINERGYGIACKYNDSKALREAILALKNQEVFQKYKENVLRDRDSWAMEEKIKEVVQWLKRL